MHYGILNHIIKDTHLTKYEQEEFLNMLSEMISIHVFQRIQDCPLVEFCI